MKIKWVSTTESEPWQEKNLVEVEGNHQPLTVTQEVNQEIHGFGGCFNELGWIALSSLEAYQKDQIIQSLFDPEMGCKFNMCRMPIGASDYAEKWYSHNEVENDYEMEHFSIDRDYKYLLPYIQSAMKYRQDLKLFASPWSPPTWMKTPKAYNNGRLNMDDKNLKAYALYFKMFVAAYEKEHITIDQIHIQNEPFADQKFPSCLWSGEQFRVFIRDYLGPLFESSGLSTEIWLGTLNGPEQMKFLPTGQIIIDLFDTYVDCVLGDPEAKKYISGVGYQWAGQQALQRTHDSYPELSLMQTENECGDGQNSWTYAQYVFNLIRHYLRNGVNSYVYWNMVLEPEGISTWGWHQNAMITVDPKTKLVTYNPEFYVMKHFSAFVEKGAKRLTTEGPWSGASVAFENPNGDIVIVTSNAMDVKRQITITTQYGDVSVTLEANSFNTFHLSDN